MKNKIKLNSLVKIIYGKDKGKIGKIIKIIKKEFVYVENIKLIKKHIKDNYNLNKNNKINFKFESKIHISNVCLIK